MHKDDPDRLEALFEAARRDEPQMAEHARRRILLDAAAMQPQAASPRKAASKKSGWLFSVWQNAMAGAAAASLSLGLGLGVWQSDSIGGLAGFYIDAEVPGEWSGGLDDVFLESESS